MTIGIYLKQTAKLPDRPGPPQFEHCRYRETPVNRHVDRTLLPSTKAATTADRFAVLSLFTRHAYII